MATQDVQISDLTQVNTPATTDLLLIRHGTVDSKITYSDIKSAINTNTLYASSDGVVTDQANQYYNKSEVRSMVDDLQNQIDTLNSSVYLFNGGVALTSNSDLNTETYCTYGTYYSNSMDISGTLQNCPVSTVFRMTVEDMASGLSANYRYIRRTIISGTAQSNYTVYTQICYKSGPGKSFVFGDWVLSPTRSEIDSLNSRTSTYLLSSSENLLTVVLDDTILPPRSQKLFDLRNANNTDLPEAGAVYGMAVAIKRTSGNCTVMIYGDGGTIWHNSHASNQSWKGWSEL